MEEGEEEDGWERRVEVEVEDGECMASNSLDPFGVKEGKSAG